MALLGAVLCTGLWLHLSHIAIAVTPPSKAQPAYFIPIAEFKHIQVIAKLACCFVEDVSLFN